MDVSELVVSLSGPHTQSLTSAVPSAGSRFFLFVTTAGESSARRPGRKGGVKVRVVCVYVYVARTWNGVLILLSTAILETGAGRREWCSRWTLWKKDAVKKTADAEAVVVAKERKEIA